MNKCSLVLTLFALLYIDHLGAKDYLSFDHAAGRFNADFSLRQSGIKSYRQGSYAQAIIHLDKSIKDVVSQKALFYYGAATIMAGQTKKHIPPLLKPSISIGKHQVEIMSLYPLRQVLLDNKVLPIFLYSLWHEDKITVNLPNRVLSLFSTKTPTLVIKPFFAQAQKQTLGTVLPISKLSKHVVSLKTITDHHIPLAALIDNQIKVLLAQHINITPLEHIQHVVDDEMKCLVGLQECSDSSKYWDSRSEAIKKSARNRVHVKIVEQITVNNSPGVEVWVALIDNKQGKIIDTKAFFASHYNKEKLALKLAEDITWFVVGQRWSGKD